MVPRESQGPEETGPQVLLCNCRGSGLLCLSCFPSATPDTDTRAVQGSGRALPSHVLGPPLTTLLVAIVTAVIVTITVPQTPDAVAVLAGELILLTLPGGCGHREVRLLQAVGASAWKPTESLAEQSSQAAPRLP